METAGDAQMLGAALNHSALNLANALGAWLGGLVIAAGLGYRAPSAVGAGLAVAGLVPLGCSAVLRRRTLRAVAASRRSAPPSRRSGSPPPDRRRRCNDAATLRGAAPARSGRAAPSRRSGRFRRFRAASAESAAVAAPPVAWTEVPQAVTDSAWYSGQ